MKNIRFILFAALGWIVSSMLFAQEGGQTVHVPPGKSVTISVTATGTPPFNYQWYKDGAAISGATTASITIAAYAATNAGAYHVVVSNAAGEVSSPKAFLLSLLPPTNPVISITVK